MKVLAFGCREAKSKGQIKYLSLNNEPCQPRPTLIDLNPGNKVLFHYKYKPKEAI